MAAREFGLVAEQIGAELQIFRDAHRGKDAAPFRHQHEAHRGGADRIAARYVGAAEAYRAVGGDEPHHGAHQGGFAGPVRSENGDELAFANEQIDGRQCLDMPVACRERFDVQNAAGRAHFATSTLPFTILASSSGFSVMPW